MRYLGKGEAVEPGDERFECGKWVRVIYSTLTVTTDQARLAGAPQDSAARRPGGFAFIDDRHERLIVDLYDDHALIRMERWTDFEPHMKGRELNRPATIDFKVTLEHGRAIIACMQNGAK